MKRITSLFIVMVMLLSFLPAGAVIVRAESAMTASDECIQVLKLEEGFSRTPYWDFTQYTVGYGSSCPSDMVEYYTQNGITEEEAEVLLRNHLTSIEHYLNTRIVDKYSLTLTQNQFDALVLFSYNCGTAWTYETGGTFHNAIATGATGNDLIRAFALWCSAGNQIRTFLLRRRLSEANMYLNGVYSQTPPDNYCYVLYDANGGTTSPRSQGYDSNLTAAPFPVAEMAGYTFQGWFTAKTGGTKVTVLDASTKGATLYAQWADGEGNAPPSNDATPEKPVTVTVTGTDVNLRQGPGTNYTRVGTATQGQQLVITETATGSGYTWGKFDGGWIALEYTDYETVIQNQNPDTSNPSDSTETPDNNTTETPDNNTTETPDNNTTETPDNNTTETPDTSNPSDSTETPDTSNPSDSTETPDNGSTGTPDNGSTGTPDNDTTETPDNSTEPEKPKVTGTINVQEWLRIRSGPGTSYSVAGYLKPQQKVEILEQTTVGNTVWGKIAEGWISMDYVILDNNSSTGGSTSTPNTWTGKVTASELLIRSGPGTNYSILGYYTNGTAVTITERKTNGSMEWGKTDKGWICLNYVALDTNNTTTPTPNPETKPEGVTGYANVQEWLRVRSGPGTSYSVAGYLQPREKVTITEQKTVGSMVWGKISQGWVSMDYIVLDGGSSSTPTADVRTIVADCLRVRSGPGTSNTIVSYLYYGAKVTILETATASDGSTWGKISNGWISLDYTRK